MATITKASTNSRHPILIQLPPILTLYLVITVIATRIASASDHHDLGDLDLYKIAWKGPLKDGQKFNEENVIDISTKNKERYKCVVPDSVEQLNFDTSAKNSSSGESAKGPIQILEPLLQSNYCSYKFGQYWVYELCHGKFLRQYHEESTNFASKITQEYYLGKMEPEKINEHIEEYDKERVELERTGQSRPTILVDGHYKPYLMFNMTGGTKCDLTLKPRISKIIYVCNEEQKHELYSIKETSTCEYEAIVRSPLLCLHQDFKIDTNTQYDINCYSIDGSPKRPTKLLEVREDEEYKSTNKHLGVAYYQGRTLIIDADLLLS